MCLGGGANWSPGRQMIVIEAPRAAGSETSSASRGRTGSTRAGGKDGDWVETDGPNTATSGEAAPASERASE